MPLLVTATPPTPNGSLHLGHVSGPYLAADAYVRSERKRGREVFLISGIDDYQTYTDVRARQSDSTAAEVADLYGTRIQESWRRAAVRFDVVGQPRSDARHRQLVQAAFTTLRESRTIVPRTRALPWCENCGSWLFEAYVRGQCPHCDAPSGGNACEVCGRPNDCRDLRAPTCATCGRPAELRECERLYLVLDEMQDDLKKFWARATMPSHLQRLVFEMLHDGLPEISVSHPSRWGITVPNGEYPDHTIYVWFEMALGYLAAAARLPVAEADWTSVWKNHDWEIEQFFGYDNGYFHTVLFPAIYMAFDEEIRLPTRFQTNEFLRLREDKFSTSRNHAIWMDEYVEPDDYVARDSLRVYLASIRPEARQTSFVECDFRQYLTGGLPAIVVDWIAGFADRARSVSGIVHTDDAIAHDPPNVLSTSGRLAREVRDLMRRDDLPLSTVSAVLTALAIDGYSYGTHSDHLRTERSIPVAIDPWLAWSRVVVEAHLVRAFAHALEPLAPDIAATLLTVVGTCACAAGDMRCRDIPTCPATAPVEAMRSQIGAFSSRLGSLAP